MGVIGWTARKRLITERGIKSEVNRWRSLVISNMLQGGAKKVFKTAKALEL